MTPITFFALTAKMRKAQQKYFSLPAYHPEKSKWLAESKRLEGILDCEITRALSLVDADQLRAAYAPYDTNTTTQQTLPL